MKLNKFEVFIRYINKAYNDFFNPLIYEVCIDNSNKLKQYYFVFNKKELLSGGSYNFKFDDNGIPIVKGHFVDSDEKYFYNPQAIGQYALAVFHEYLKNNNKTERDVFLKLANWFVNNSKKNNNLIYWSSNKIGKSVYSNRKANEISSMSQSRAISVLLRAYQLTNDYKYLKNVNLAIKAYKLTKKNGGFLVRRNKNILFEEPGNPSILNHMIFTLFGLIDYCRFKNYDTEYSKLLTDALESIKNILPRYDAGWWSYYDDFYINDKRRYNVCTRHYINIHINQLLVLAKIFDDETFYIYHKKWKEYNNNYFNRLKMLFYKMIAVKKMNRL
ncbi:MAG: D-glucuronyl C5-epimerase family protein [archaeon]